MISPVLSSKFSVSVLTAGTEYSWSDSLAITVVADGVGVTGSFVDGVEEEEVARDRFYLRSDSGSSMKLYDKSKPGIHYPIFIHNRRKQAKLSYINNGHY